MGDKTYINKDGEGMFSVYCHDNGYCSEDILSEFEAGEENSLHEFAGDTFPYPPYRLESVETIREIIDRSRKHKNAEFYDMMYITNHCM